MTVTIHQKHIDALRHDFSGEVAHFLRDTGLPTHQPFRFTPTPVFIVTGVNFTLYDETQHGTAAHAFYDGPTPRDQKYLMNNTAAILSLLLKEGRRVLVHSGTPDLCRVLMDLHPHSGNVAVISGDLSQKKILKPIYGALAQMQTEQPISAINLALYQSFAQQGTGAPFKPMHIENVAEVERATSRRLRFIYNMAAMSYDFLMNRALPELRIVSLSALASQRATYGLLADAADKYMNELAWRTFHLEANISTGKKVSIYQVNPGITAACDVYQRDNVRNTVCRESLADGFPLDDDILAGDAPLPQLNALDVAWVAHALLTTPAGENPNRDMPDHIYKLLYGGFTREEFHERFNRVIRQDQYGIAIDPDRVFPEHILAPGTQYGALPQTLQPGDYKRISLCPPGQRF